MKKIVGVLLFALIIINVVGFVVFNSGNEKENGTKLSDNNSYIPLSNSNKSDTVPQTNSSSFITPEEIAKHSSAEDCWVAYKGKVYDVTKFLPKHPGSAGAIIPYCGTAKEFEDAFVKQHGTSKSGMLMKVAVFIGDFEIKGAIK